MWSQIIFQSTRKQFFSLFLWFGNNVVYLYCQCGGHSCSWSYLVSSGRVFLLHLVVSLNVCLFTSGGLVFVRWNYYLCHPFGLLLLLVLHCRFTPKINFWHVFEVWFPNIWWLSLLTGFYEDIGSSMTSVLQCNSCIG